MESMWEEVSPPHKAMETLKCLAQVNIVKDLWCDVKSVKGLYINEIDIFVNNYQVFGVFESTDITKPLECLEHNW